MTMFGKHDGSSLALSLINLDLWEAQWYLSHIVRHTYLDADSLAEALKKKTDELIGVAHELAWRSAHLLFVLAEVTANPLHRALGLRAIGNVLHLANYQHQEAIECYDEATGIYQACGRPADAACSQVGKVSALAWMGRHEQAYQVYQAISPVLQVHGRQFEFANAKFNWANIVARQGDELTALQYFNEVRFIYLRLGDAPEYRQSLAEVENNRALSLISLWRFDEAEQAIKQAREILIALGQHTEAVRPLGNLAIMRILQGRLNEALALRKDVQTTWRDHGRLEEAMIADLEISDVLLTICRFHDVQKICQQSRPLFEQREMPMEQAFTLVNEGIACAGLKDYPLARTKLQEGQKLFEAMNSPVLVAITDLEIALVDFHQRKFSRSLQTGQKCMPIFEANNLPYRVAQAQIIVARSALELGQLSLSEACINQVLALESSIPSLSYHAHALRGRLYALRRQFDLAISAYHTAITFLERLRGSLMVEFRAGFLEDKHVLYEDVVHLYISQNQPGRALEYVERARSRALLDMVSYRLDMRIQPRLPEDIGRVEQLEKLLAERNRWYCRRSRIDQRANNDWREHGDDPAIPGLQDAGRAEADHQILCLEEQITSLREELLIDNAEYAHDATLWQVQSVSIEQLQQDLDSDTIVVEYFLCQNQFMVFLMSRNQVQVHQLACDVDGLTRTLVFLEQNYRQMLQGSGLRNILTVKARARLKQLYDWLIAPCAATLATYSHLYIVPHGILHYLPFHALYDGTSFLIERHQISYLPAASIMSHCAEPRRSASGMVAFGHSWDGRLPNAVQEARNLAQRWNGTVFVEQAAHLAQIGASAHTCRILHISAHAVYNESNPLFSGLHLDDGQLTTLDIFNLKLRASLVTLSACETGRHVIGGGDELLGLTRAFLYAGAASLVLSLWKVEDASASCFMNHFYERLQQGDTKGSALREAQLHLLQSEEYNHPYFWAPFILIGHAGTLE